jgi:hypothetical protein
MLVVATGAVALGPSGAAEAGAAPGFQLTLDQGRALFELTNMVPGPLGGRCVSVDTANGSSDATVLSAAVGGDGLADYLMVTIEADVADPTACSTFAGSVLFHGTLTDLGRLHGSPAAGLPVRMADGRHALVRFSLTLLDDNAAMGKRASASFRFDAEQGPVVLANAATPDTRAGATPTASTAANGPPPSAAAVAPRTTLAKAAAPSGLAAALAKLGARAVKSVKLASKAASPPAFLFLVIFLFLAIQHRIDRSDPKLALAPVQPEPDLEFLAYQSRWYR